MQQHSFQPEIEPSMVPRLANWCIRIAIYVAGIYDLISP